MEVIYVWLKNNLGERDYGNDLVANKGKQYSHQLFLTKNFAIDYKVTKGTSNKVVSLTHNRTCQYRQSITSAFSYFLPYLHTPFAMNEVMFYLPKTIFWSTFPIIRLEFVVLPKYYTYLDYTFIPFNKGIF